MSTVLEGGGTATAEQILELHEVFAKFNPTLQTKTDIQGNEDTELVITANELGVVSLPYTSLPSPVCKRALVQMIDV